MATRNTPNQTQFDYYGPLLIHYVKAILECGLLLDEDYEVLLNVSNFKMYATKSTAIPYGLITSGLATLVSVFVAKKSGRAIVMLPPLGATLVLLCLERMGILRRRRHEEIVNCLIKCLMQLRKLNTSIIRYLKLRDSSKLSYNENVHEFLAGFIEKNKTYFSVILKEISHLVDLAGGDLKEDFQGVKEINIESILTLDNDNYDLLTTRVQDVNTFLTSKYLNYLALILCKNVRNINVNELEILLDEKLLYMCAVLDELSGSVQKEFNNLRYCTSKKLEIDMLSRRSFPKQVSGKLQQTLIGAVNNLSIIMEKSRGILGKVQDIDDDKDVDSLRNALSDLRAHAFATYESLDVLCKLYGILSDAKKAPKQEAFNRKYEYVNEGDVTIISYDDQREAVEENYELYIPDMAEGDMISPEETSEDQAGMYLSLMLRELRQSLRQDDRFIAARSKRGISEGDTDETDSREKKTVPKFDLKAKLPIPAPRTSKLPPSVPPPPPPPPPLRVDWASASEATSNRTLLENVKTLSSQLQGHEDVFGDDCSSDSD